MSSASFPESNLIIHPNPASSLIQIEYVGEVVPAKEIKLYNAVGQILYTAPLKTGKTSLDVSAFTPGMYVLDCGDVTQKVVVE